MAGKTSTNGFVLAGGKSRRMGRDKALVEWGNTSLLEHMAKLLLTVADKVQIIGRGDFPDKITGKGPLGGILTALSLTDRDDNLFVAVDLPLLTPTFLNYFQDRFLASPKNLMACRVGSRFPLCLGIRPRLVDDVARRVEDGRLAIHTFIEESDPEILEPEELGAQGFDPTIFLNINTSDDLAKFR